MCENKTQRRGGTSNISRTVDFHCSRSSVDMDDDDPNKEPSAASRKRRWRGRDMADGDRAVDSTRVSVTPTLENVCHTTHNRTSAI